MRTLLFVFLWEGVVVLFGDGDVGLEVWFGLRKERGRGSGGRKKERKTKRDGIDRQNA